MSDRKKVLIISYYWPPSSGAGVHRWLKISKYLSKQTNCYVYTPKNPDFDLKDDSLRQKVASEITVLKRKIFEPYFIYKLFLKKKDRKNVNAPDSVTKGKQGLIKQAAAWIRGNVFVPDPRIFWVKPSGRFLKRYLKREGIDNIITTGPPHSMHLIGRRLKRHFGDQINWIADFRDPWTEIDFYDMLNVGKAADKRNRKMEKSVLQEADTVVCISPGMKRDLERLGAKNAMVITNGFDPDDYDLTTATDTNHFYLTHIGSINADRNPKMLWKTLQKLTSEHAELKSVLKIKLIGGVHPEVLEAISKSQLNEHLIKIDYLPHKEALDHLHRGTISLLFLNNTKTVDCIMPGKMFEYIGVGKPIYAIGKPDGDAGKVIREYGLGEISDFEDETHMVAVINNFFKQYREGQINAKPAGEESPFSIPSISRQFFELLR